MAVRSCLDTLTFRMGNEARTHVNGVQDCDKKSTTLTATRPPRLLYYIRKMAQYMSAQKPINIDHLYTVNNKSTKTQLKCQKVRNIATKQQSLITLNNTSNSGISLWDMHVHLTYVKLSYIVINTNNRGISLGDMHVHLIHQNQSEMVINTRNSGISLGDMHVHLIHQNQSKMVINTRNSGISLGDMHVPQGNSAIASVNHHF